MKGKRLIEYLILAIYVQAFVKAFGEGVYGCDSGSNGEIYESLDG